MAKIKIESIYIIDLGIDELVSFLNICMPHLKCIIDEELLDNIGFSYHSHFGGNSLDLSKVNHIYEITPTFLECHRNLESLLSLNQFNDDAVNIIFNYISCCLDPFLAYLSPEYRHTLYGSGCEYSRVILNVHHF